MKSRTLIFLPNYVERFFLRFGKTLMLITAMYFLVSHNLQAQCTLFTTGGGGNLCVGSTGLSVTLSGSTTGVSYQLKNGSTNVGSALAGTGSSLTWTNNTTSGTYTIVATKSTAPTCTATMTGSVNVVVNPLPSLFTVSGGGLAPATINLSGSQTGVTYQVKINGTNSGTPLAGTGSALSWTSQSTLGTYTVSATNTTTTCTQSMTGSATVLTLPTSPASLTAAATSSTTINLAWADNSNNESGFLIERSLTAGTGYTLIFTTSANATAYTSTGLTAATKYYYRIRATNAGGNSAYTSEVNATTGVAGTLVGQWRLNNDATDASGNTITGTLMNGASFTTSSKEGSYALQLNGYNQYIDFGNPSLFPSGNTSRTICAWAKSNNVTNGYQWIFAYGSPSVTHAMFIGAGGTTLVGGSYAGDLTATNFWQIGVWHHVCLTYDGTTARLYGDGVQVSSSAASWILTPGKAYIGRQINDAEYWNGSIDDVRIYNKALTPSEIQALIALPSAPTTLGAVASSSTTVNLTWVDNSTNETGFQVERSLTSGTGYTLIATTTANAISYSDTGLTPGTKYYYRIRSTNASGSSAYATEVNATTWPTAPSALVATTGSTTTINLSWTDNSTNETGFQVERSLTFGTGYSLVTTTAANIVSYLDVNLTAGTSYYYRVRAITTGATSAYTPEATATTTPLPPIAPSSLIATAAPNTTINLRWIDNSTNETGFQVERSLTSGTGFTLISTTEANALVYADANLSANTKYYYRIRSQNAGGTSAYSSEASVTTFDLPPTTPAALLAMASSSTSVTLNWTDNATNETGFIIERSLTTGSGYTLVATTDANSVSYSDANLSAGTTYFYRIKAINDGGASAYTTEVTATLIVPGVTQLCKNLYCDSHGGVGIGTQIIPAGYVMAINGKVMAEGVKVALKANWPDYVFDKDYSLIDIPTLKKYIAINGHLPNVPTTETVEKEGIDLEGINVLLLEKIEEMSLYLIQIEERMKNLETENTKLKADKTKN